MGVVLLTVERMRTQIDLNWMLKTNPLLRSVQVLWLVFLQKPVPRGLDQLHNVRENCGWTLYQVIEQRKNGACNDEIDKYLYCQLHALRSIQPRLHKENSVGNLSNKRNYDVYKIFIIRDVIVSTR